jgi:hypothetical protein
VVLLLASIRLQTLANSCVFVVRNCVSFYLLVKTKSLMLLIACVSIRVVQCTCLQIFFCMHIIRVGQNCTYTSYMTVHMVISLPIIPYIHRVYL